MRVICAQCREYFDDADRSTICPHDLLMPQDLLDQKKLGLALLGRQVRFNHMTSGRTMRVESVQWDGMITVEGLVGLFAPHLFTVVST